MAAVKNRPPPRRSAIPISFRVNTLGEVAEFFGVGLDAVGRWRMGDNPMPGDSVSGYDLSEVAKWDRAKRKSGGGIGDELKAADIRLKTAQAVAKELENSVTSGDLLDRGDVERWAATALIEAREMVMALPEMLATSSPPDQREFIRSESDRHCRDVLTMLRRRLEADEIAGDEVPPATTEGDIG